MTCCHVETPVVMLPRRPSRALVLPLAFTLLTLACGDGRIVPAAEIRAKLQEREARPNIVMILSWIILRPPASCTT